MSEVITEEKVVQALTCIDQAKQIAITDDDGYRQAGELGKRAKELKTAIEKEYESPIKKANALHKELIGKRNAHTGPLEEAMVTLRNGMTAYKQKQARLRAEQEAAERKLAEAKARKERERLEAEALAAAENNDAQGFEQKVVEKEMITPEAYIPVSTPPVKTDGVSHRANWQCEVTDFRALIGAVASGQAPIDCIQANMTYLKQRAKLDKGNFRVTGVRAWDKGTVIFK